ncbi:MAG: hypothetical protein K2Z81_14910, partial [Cyanobacteria bacterium]|nr:hypothetical protein [Cyanobacteriota bacterium]
KWFLRMEFADGGQTVEECDEIIHPLKNLLKGETEELAKVRMVDVIAQQLSNMDRFTADRIPAMDFDISLGRVVGTDSAGTSPDSEKMDATRVAERLGRGTYDALPEVHIREVQEAQSNARAALLPLRQRQLSPDSVTRQRVSEAAARHLLPVLQTAARHLGLPEDIVSPGNLVFDSLNGRALGEYRTKSGIIALDTNTADLVNVAVHELAHKGRWLDLMAASRADPVGFRLAIADACVEAAGVPGRLPGIDSIYTKHEFKNPEALEQFRSLLRSSIERELAQDGWLKQDFTPKRVIYPPELLAEFGGSEDAVRLELSRQTYVFKNIERDVANDAFTADEERERKFGDKQVPESDSPEGRKAPKPQGFTGLDDAGKRYVLSKEQVFGNWLSGKGKGGKPGSTSSSADGVAPVPTSSTEPEESAGAGPQGSLDRTGDGIGTASGAVSTRSLRNNPYITKLLRTAVVDHFGVQSRQAREEYAFSSDEISSRKVDVAERAKRLNTEINRQRATIVRLIADELYLGESVSAEELHHLRVVYRGETGEAPPSDRFLRNVLELRGGKRLTEEARATARTLTDAFSESNQPGFASPPPAREGSRTGHAGRSGTVSATDVATARAQFKELTDYLTTASRQQELNKALMEGDQQRTRELAKSLVTSFSRDVVGNTPFVDYLLICGALQHQDLEGTAFEGFDTPNGRARAFTISAIQQDTLLDYHGIITYEERESELGAGWREFNLERPASVERDGRNMDVQSIAVNEDGSAQLVSRKLWSTEPSQTMPMSELWPDFDRYCSMLPEDPRLDPESQKAALAANFLKQLESRSAKPPGYVSPTDWTADDESSVGNRRLSDSNDTAGKPPEVGDIIQREGRELRVVAYDGDVAITHNSRAFEERVEMTPITQAKLDRDYDRVAFMDGDKEKVRYRQKGDRLNPLCSVVDSGTGKMLMTTQDYLTYSKDVLAKPEPKPLSDEELRELEKRNARAELEGERPSSRRLPVMTEVVKSPL